MKITLGISFANENLLQILILNKPTKPTSEVIRRRKNERLKDANSRNSPQVSGATNSPKSTTNLKTPAKKSKPPVCGATAAPKAKEIPALSPLATPAAAAEIKSVDIVGLIKTSANEKIKIATEIEAAICKP